MPYNNKKPLLSISTFQVSWIRHKDTHLLTLGLYSYTKDPRLSAIHRSNSEDWVLEIRSTIPSDAGITINESCETIFQVFYYFLKTSDHYKVARGLVQTTMVSRIIFKRVNHLSILVVINVHTHDCRSISFEIQKYRKVGIRVQVFSV